MNELCRHAVTNTNEPVIQRRKIFQPTLTPAQISCFLSDTRLFWVQIIAKIPEMDFMSHINIINVSNWWENVGKKEV